MTNLTRANGTLKLVNRKLVGVGTDSGVVQLEAVAAAAVNQHEEVELQQQQHHHHQQQQQQQSKRHLAAIADEDLKENRLERVVRVGEQVNGLQRDQHDQHEHSDQNMKLKQRLQLAACRESGEPADGAGAKLAHQPANGTKQAEPVKEEEEFEAPLVWFNIFLFVVLHSSIPVGVYQFYTHQVAWPTILWSILGMYISGLGVTGGAHRLWSHRSYKASLPVELLLMALQTMAGQNSIYTWCRDHRVHHKFSETNADPHNIKRGFFFAHMGWLCCRKHPEVKAKGKLIDMSDLEANWVVMFQHRHFWWLAILFTVLLPSYLPVLLWRERFWTSFTYSFMLRYLITLHGTWLVNSAAHYFGSRPYDGRIEARESPFVIATGLGEGFHNYHHTFPYDYSTSEFGKYFNITTAFIDACAALQLVHDRRKMDRAMIDSRMARTGDSSRLTSKQKQFIECRS